MRRMRRQRGGARRRWDGMHRRSAVPRWAGSVAASLLVAALVAPAGAAPAAGGQAGYDHRSSRTTDVTGPVVPSVDWVRRYEDFAYPAGLVPGHPMVADAAGHLLLSVRRVADGEGVLLAVDRDDGAVAWTVEGHDPIQAYCPPAARADGVVFASRDGGLDNEIMAIDAADGAVLGTWRPDGFIRMMTCDGSLRIAPDGTLLVGAVVQQSVTEALPALFALDFDRDRGFSQRWARPYEELRLPSRSVWAGRPVISADGRRVYVARERADGEEAVVDLLRLDDGTLLDTEAVEGFRLLAGGASRVAADADGFVVATDDNRPGSAEGWITRLLDTGTGLDRGWAVATADEPAIPQAFGSLALTDDAVVGFAGSTTGAVVALDLADGSVRWTHQASSFIDIYRVEEAAVDGAGNVHFRNAAPINEAVLESLFPDGRVRYRTPAAEAFLGDALAGSRDTLYQVGPVLDDGRLYATTPSALLDDATTGIGANPVIAAVVDGPLRLDGSDGSGAPGSGEPIDVAVQTCRYLFGDGGARTVVLARADVFADTLAGAPLAGDDSCVLFTPGGPDAPLDIRTRLEIGRVLPAGGTVRVLGGTDAVSTLVQSTLEQGGYVVERLSGPTRFDTALEVARAVVAENPDARGDRAVLAYAFNWPDAVTAGAWAAAEGVPVLLTDTAALADQARVGLTEFGTSSTLVAGGQAVVSDAALVDVPAPVRVSGPERTATAAEVARVLWGMSGTDGRQTEPRRPVVLVNLYPEDGWTLALAAGPLSARVGAPQLAVDTDTLPPPTASVLAGLDQDRLPALVIGNRDTVGEPAVRAAVDATGG